MLFVITKKISAAGVKQILDFTLLEFLVFCSDVLIIKDARLEEIF